MFLLHFPAVAWATELHERVDQLVSEKAPARNIAPSADDAEFLRRVYLDFDGGIPTTDETRKFMADSTPDKRVQLIDRLFASERLSERLADVFNVWFMERRGDDAEWRKYLLESFRANKRWDAMAREILNPDFKNESTRGAGYFMTRRLEKVGEQPTDYPGLTRDVGRLFLGVDLQCAQCHKHRTIGEYEQVDFNGLFVAFKNLKLHDGTKGQKTKWVSEDLMTEKFEFASVFTGRKQKTGPRVPFGEEIPIPELSKDEQWLVPADRKTDFPGVPRFSPLKEIAERLPAPDHPFFARNIANRLWFLLVGRGLVEPMDLNHRENPPSHPELLDLLARELVAHNFDIKWLLRELARTQTYQRSSRGPAIDSTAENSFAVALERPLYFEQLIRAFLIATGEFERATNGQASETGTEKKTYSLKDFQKAFQTAFANAPTEPEYTVNPTLKAALFLRNSDEVAWALRPRRGNLMDRLMTMNQVDAIADELYLSILTRFPDAEEKAIVARYLASHGKEKAVNLWTWSLVSSVEFFVNH